jgi:hypothetical protein
MSSINDKMQNPGGTGLSLSPANIRKAGTDIRALGKALGMDTMQVLILTAIIHNSSRYHINGEAVADYLGMGYIKFLTYSKEMDELRARGYIRLDKDGDIIIPREVLNTLKENSPVEPEPISGLTTAQILSRIRRKLSIREDDEMTTQELLNEIDTLMRENPDTSIGRVYRERIQKDIYKYERIVFAVLLYRYYYLEDDIIGWHNLDDYFEDFEFDDLKGDYMAEQMDLQRHGIIEHTGVDGILSKDYFKIKDEIKEEALADVGGLKVKAPKVSASRRIEAGAITEKELFYNPVEERQVSQLRELMSEQRFADIRSKMQEQKLRTGFTCLFYGSPGTGKTETAYQIARESGRDLFVIDVSQIKSCWVGESEKNIKQVFNKYRECVAGGGTIPILLFNEADAIFGIRSEGAGSAVDKMENSIQNIILQEMEDLDGILIATTNLTTNLDKAFERRFLYKVRFDKPSTEARSHIWRTMLPELSEQEAALLAAEFDFSGGQIENISRKKTVKALISGQQPTFDEIREYCQEENIEDTRERRKIGF